ncbi:MAG: 30S ribosomal protein S16 [Candidatus Woesebacteria bacterium]|nr:30S ribosomal protein S16 [Candidatus Woesebacteria bacterium]
MVIIRLSRFGRKKAPFYRVVAVDSSKKATGKYLEVVGTWNPAKSAKTIDKDKVDAWIKKGATLSATVKKLMEE